MGLVLQLVSRDLVIPCGKSTWRPKDLTKERKIYLPRKFARESRYDEPNNNKTATGTQQDKVERKETTEEGNSNVVTGL